jgi:phosphoribosyl 1,2-cyclic phosphate phosphodiesterase
MIKVTILGSGGSSGVPAISSGWGDCDPENPRNRRLRPSILIQQGETVVLVDTSPDLRQQLLGANVRTLSAVIFTHEHADHMHGIDDLREVNRAMVAPLPIWAFPETIEGIRDRFGYVFEPLAPQAHNNYYKPVLIPHVAEPNFTIGEMAVHCFEQDHGYGRTMGLRVGSFAYSTDVVNLPESAFDILEGVDTWVVGCLGAHPHPTHAHVDRAIEWMGRVKPRRGVITHMSPKLDYEALRRSLPPGIEPAYDGLILDCP